MKKNETIKPKIDIPIDKIRKFCSKNHIRKKSDVDILVEFDSKHIPGLIGVSELEYELGEIVGRTVDLRTPKDLSPYFRNDVITKAYHLYGKKRFCAS